MGIARRGARTPGFDPRDSRVGLRWPGCLLIAASVVLLAASAHAAWLPDQRLTQDPAASRLSGSGARCVAADQLGNVHLVWYDSRNITPQIYYKRFDGALWSPDQQVTAAPASATNPCLAADSAGNLHLVWQDGRGSDFEIYYKRFDGTIWTPEVRLTNAAGSSRDPSIVTGESGRLHLAWRDTRDGNDEIYYKYFDGTVWTEDLRLTTNSGVSLGPCIAVGLAGRVHFVWYDNRDGNFEIYYKSFDGTAWSEDLRLTSDPGISESPVVVVASNGSVHVVWDDNRSGKFEIYHKVYDGVSWSGDERLTPASIVASAPSAAADDSGRVDVTWQDRPTSNDSTEIYWRRFNGADWGTVKRLTNAAGASQNARIAVDSRGSAHVAWQDSRDGNLEIYWKWTGEASPRPDIAAITPSCWSADEGLSVTDISGDNFSDGAMVWLRKASETDIQATDVVVESATRITCQICLGATPVGDWDVVVENNDAQRDTLLSGFTVAPGMWADAERLTYDSYASSLSRSNARCLAADAGGNIHMVWFDARTGHNEIFYRSCVGGTWGPEIQLTNDASSSEYPAIAVDSGGNIHVVWTDNRDYEWRIYHKKYEGTWGPDEPVSTAGSGRNPSIAAGPGDGFTVVWDDTRDGSSPAIYLRTFDGLAWGPEQKLYRTSNYSEYPSVAVSRNGNIHVVWRKDMPGADEVHYLRFDGVKWLPEVMISRFPQCSGGIQNPCITVDGDGNPHVTWNCQDGYGPPTGVFCRRSNATGWLPLEKLSAADSLAHEATVSVDASGNVYVLWAESHGGLDKIIYRLFDGEAWQPQVRLIDAPGASTYPSSTLDSDGKLHVVWSDSRDGNSEIYYRLRDPRRTAGLGPLTHEGELDAICAAPNPVRAGTGISLGVGLEANAFVAIYDVSGRLVWQRNVGPGGCGHHALVWECRDRFGRDVPPGVYFIRVDAGARAASGKVVVMR
jgi:hypothetical protein